MYISVYLNISQKNALDHVKFDQYQMSDLARIRSWLKPVLEFNCGVFVMNSDKNKYNKI